MVCARERRQGADRPLAGWRPTACRLPDGKRWHLQQGPIDLIIEAEGKPSDVAASVRQAVIAFDNVLETLVAELDELRRGREAVASAVDAPDSGRPCNTSQPMPWRVSGPVAGRMCQAAASFSQDFVTPMIAVAGGVADHVLAAMLDGHELARVYVNNGGDIALRLAAGQVFSVGVQAAGNTASGTPVRLQLNADDGVGGIATSGWQGRSHSLGIADSVTVLSRCAAQADAAATLIANAVDLPGNDKVRRLPATELDEASDLGHRCVTVGVGVLTALERSAALTAGMRVARELQANGLVIGTRLAVQGSAMVLGRHDCWIE